MWRRQFLVGIGGLLVAGGVRAESAAPAALAPLVRVRAIDIDRSAAFYTQLFGMAEVGRIDMPYPPGGKRILEITLASKTSSAAGGTGLGPTLVLMTRPDGQVGKATDDLPAAVFVVPDIQAVVDRTRQAGGEVYRPPYRQDSPESRNLGIALIADPAGNVIECVQLDR